MAFYPLNTPFINYYFYKAPFINDAYSLTNFAILSGGAGFAVNDVLILGGGTYTNPVVIQVTSILSGVITGFNITNNGKYTITPTVLTMLSTNGSGTGATFGTVISTPNLYPIGPNVPLAGGFIYFYEDENRTVQANTYSDVSDSDNPVVNPNPIQLGSSGDFPPIYMDDRLYYIVITDNTGDESNPVEVLEHYDPSDILSQRSAFNDNFIVNPQFNYPITFYKTSDEIGEITTEKTLVAFGWEFREDGNTESENYVYFEEILGLGIEGNPINQIVVDSRETSSSERTKDLVSYLGNVDFYNGDTLTFGAQMVNLFAGNTSVSISLELNYGKDGSDTQIVPLTTFTVGLTRRKYAYAFEVPEIAGKVVGEGNYLALLIKFSLLSISKVGITNVMCLPGSQLSAIFADEPYGFQKALILGEATEIKEAGLYENFSPYYYVDGKVIPYANTGDIILCPNNIAQPFRQKCDGSSLMIAEYNGQDIPYKRLYDKMGTLFGSSGSLIVTSNGNVVTFSSSIGARQLTAYTAGTTTFTVENTVIGLKFGIDLTDNGDLTVSGSFFDQFAPSQTNPTFPPTPIPMTTYVPSAASGLLTYWGAADDTVNPQNIEIATTAPGSGITNATFTINFTDPNPSNYKTRTVNIPYLPAPNNYMVTTSFIEFSTVDDNNRQPGGSATINQCIAFSVDGQYDWPLGITDDPSPRLFDIVPSQYTAVPFKSALSIHENIRTFVSTVANPFTWTVTVVSAPTAGQYFLYSSKTVDYYAWFSVNGGGVDPAVASRTGIEVPLTTGMTTTQIAAIIAETLNDAAYDVPAPSDLPALVGSSKVSWFITL